MTEHLNDTERHKPVLDETDNSVDSCYGDINEQLKPCPFCGAAYPFGPFLNQGVGRGGRYTFAVWCSECDSTSGSYYKIEYAAKAWNRREEPEE